MVGEQGILQVGVGEASGVGIGCGQRVVSGEWRVGREVVVGEQGRYAEGAKV